MHRFPRIERLPPYVFATINELKHKARQAGEDIIDLGMGNPDLPTPPHIVEKMIEVSSNPKNHRYSVSRGIVRLREAICKWYQRRYDIDLDLDTEAIVTIGAKEGIAHLLLATLERGDVVLVPTPTYPIHSYASIIAGADVHLVPFTEGQDFFESLVVATERILPRPKMVVLSFPHNPTTQTVDLEFFKKVIDFAKRYNLLVVHDFAYADIVFDGYQAPSFLQVPGAKEVGVELFSLSKSYNMPGWRLGFVVGNREMIYALARIKSYFDYGIFQPLQIAGILALNGPQECVSEIVETYRVRRDVLIQGLARAGWVVPSPKATMFVWAKIPEKFQPMGSIEFTKFLLQSAKVAVSPGIGFGEAGNLYVRFALVENEHRIRQATRGIREALDLVQPQARRRAREQQA
ncbi:MAG: alanine transaminase [Deltaproteobacteria bacterium]|nr:alanine transaminase [Deltaproteobacteria bacterium]